MSIVKTYGAIAIMITCFAVIYPRFMHPFVLRAFGADDSSAKTSGEDAIYPPGYKGRPHPSQQPERSAHDDVRRHMRHGPHPGMRAAAEMQRQQSQTGSGRGMMGVVLPMYAIGIVLYLLYTLFKVFNKSKNNSWSRPGQYSRQRGDSVGRDRMGFPQDFDGSTSDVTSFLHDQQQRRDLEDLLTRVDDKNVSVEEMRLLQARLEETEAQMTRILRAMQAVQTNVDTVAAQAGGEGVGQSPDSSPDMDTYEVVDRAQSGDMEPRSSKPDKDIAEDPSDKPQGTTQASNTPPAKGKVEDADLEGIDDEEEEEEDDDASSDDEEEEEEKIASSHKETDSTVRQRNIKVENEP